MNYLNNEEGVSLKGASSFMLRNVVINSYSDLYEGIERIGEYWIYIRAI